MIFGVGHSKVFQKTRSWYVSSNLLHDRAHTHEIHEYLKGIGWVTSVAGVGGMERCGDNVRMMLQVLVPGERKRWRPYQSLDTFQVTKWPTGWGRECGISLHF